MFKGCSPLKFLSDLSKWDTFQVEHKKSILIN